MQPTFAFTLVHAILTWCGHALSIGLVALLTFDAITVFVFLCVLGAFRLAAWLRGGVAGQEVAQ